jgi:nucleoside-diphosphate-sugar epimerase
VADISKIRAELGYDPAVSVEDGLRRLVEFTTVGR